jgi:rsbT antagonist protein RsbS
MDRVPILKIGDVLLVSIQVDMQDHMAMQLQADLGERIVETGCRGVIIDITGLDIVDSFVGRTLSTIASISRVLDAETVVVGMRPAVAITLVELGLSLSGIRTAMNVERGLRLLAAATSAQPVGVLEDSSDTLAREPHAPRRAPHAEGEQEKLRLT